MLDRINAVPWGHYAQPEWNKPNSIAEALAKVVRADPGAYNSLLYAVGNNHAGTYYPVLLAVLPFLEEILHVGEPASQRVALCVLDDLFASFQPEPGFEEFDPPEGGTQRVEAAFKQRIHQLGSVLDRIDSAGNSNSLLASQLRQLLSEDAV